MQYGDRDIGRSEQLERIFHHMIMPEKMIKLSQKGLVALTGGNTTGNTYITFKPVKLSS